MNRNSKIEIILEKLKSLTNSKKKKENDFKKNFEQLTEEKNIFLKKIKDFQKRFNTELTFSLVENNFLKNFYQESRDKFQQTKKELFWKKEDFKQQIQQKKIELTTELIKQQKTFKTNVFKYVFNAKIRNLLSAPFIYVLLPFIMVLDIMIEIYHRVCFKLYGLPYVKRSNYIVIDRHKLAYLNFIEKINCCYCGYGNWLVAYRVKIFAETERYWCPIKHNNSIPQQHNRYNEFANYEDAQKYKEIIKEIHCKEKRQSK